MLVANKVLDDLIAKIGSIVPTPEAGYAIDVQRWSNYENSVADGTVIVFQTGCTFDQDETPTCHDQWIGYYVVLIYIEPLASTGLSYDERANIMGFDVVRALQADESEWIPEVTRVIVQSVNAFAEQETSLCGLEINVEVTFRNTPRNPFDS